MLWRHVYCSILTSWLVSRIRRFATKAVAGNPLLETLLVELLHADLTQFFELDVLQELPLLVAVSLRCQTLGFFFVLHEFGLPNIEYLVVRSVPDLVGAA